MIVGPTAVWLLVRPMNHDGSGSKNIAFYLLKHKRPFSRMIIKQAQCIEFGGKKGELYTVFPNSI